MTAKRYQQSPVIIVTLCCLSVYPLPFIILDDNYMQCRLKPNCSAAKFVRANHGSVVTTKCTSFFKVCLYIMKLAGLLAYVEQGAKSGHHTTENLNPIAHYISSNSMARRKATECHGKTSVKDVVSKKLADCS